jgi:uroporphyrin-III C-methyltransferase
MTSTITPTPGTVYLVGAGPGAPDLLTVRAVRVLEAADVVFHDALVHPDTLALATRARLVPVGKRCGRHSTAQRFINKRLVDAARDGRIVVRLKGGDPMLFGRAQEEIAALADAGVPCAVVPGITAALAAAATLRTSLTERGRVRSVVLATARAGDGESGAGSGVAALAAADAGALYMGAGQAAAIAAALVAAGKPGAWPVAIVESASLPGETISYTTLGEMAQSPPTARDGPVILLAGPQFTRAARCDPDVGDAEADDARRAVDGPRRAVAR